jgi:hypothetical protein
MCMCALDFYPWPTADARVMIHRDGSGTITFDEFKTVFSANIGPDAIPFNFDWCVVMSVSEQLAWFIEETHTATGSSFTWGRRVELTSLAVCALPHLSQMTTLTALQTMNSRN